LLWCGWWRKSTTLYVIITSTSKCDVKNHGVNARTSTKEDPPTSVVCLHREDRSWSFVVFPKAPSMRPCIPWPFCFVLFKTVLRRHSIAFFLHHMRKIFSKSHLSCWHNFTHSHFMWQDIHSITLTRTSTLSLSPDYSSHLWVEASRKYNI